MNYQDAVEELAHQAIERGMAIGSNRGMLDPVEFWSMVWPQMYSPRAGEFQVIDGQLHQMDNGATGKYPLYWLTVDEELPV